MWMLLWAQLYAQRLSEICSSLTEDMHLAVIPTTQDRKNALNDLHRSGVSIVKELLSLKLLTAIPKLLQSRPQAIRKDRQIQNFLQSCHTKEDRARLISCRKPLAGKWLEAIPCSQNFSLTNAQFCTAAFMRLKMSLPQLSNIKKCIN